MVSAVTFKKEWTDTNIENKIREIFKDQLTININFEYLVPIQGDLVKPNIGPGESLNGSMLHKVFHQKPIYVRPTQSIDKNQIEENFLDETENREKYV